ncbi:M16 family metallopeptidase [Chloroherpeton thalassium]|nr:pitrilysin family protein [Chloroherpeton thalassium]
MKRLLQKTLFSLMLCGLSLLQIQCSSVMPRSFSEENRTEFDLENGLHVILHRENSVPILSAYMLYHVGSKDEDPQKTGFAHFFEHLMFSGTKHILRDELSEFVTGAGGTMNAVTDYDYTSYYINIPANELRLALWILSEQMFNLEIDSFSVETERRAIREERRMRYDNQPYGSVYEELVSLVFAGSPYSWVPIGSVQYIDEAAPSEFQAFYKTYYAPNNATLVLAGDFDTEEARALVSAYFGDIPKGEKIQRPRVRLSPPDSLQKIKIVEKPTTPLPAAIYAWQSVPQTHSDRLPLTLLRDILANGESSRLYRKFVYETELAAEVSAISFSLEQTGLFAIFIAGNAQSEFSTLDSLLFAETEKLLGGDISETELQKAINRKKTHEASAYGTMFNRAAALAKNHALQTAASENAAQNDDATELEDITPEMLKAIARKYFSRDRCFRLYYPRFSPEIKNQ